MVNGKSLLQRNIEYLQKFQIKEVVVNVHHFADQIIDAIKKTNGWGSKILISDETHEVLETGGGFLKAASFLQETNPIVLMNVDILTDLNLEAMICYHQEKKPLVTLATSDRKTSRYFLFDEANKLCGWRNVQTGEERIAAPLSGSETQKAFSGIHVVESKIFSLIRQKGKFSMVDVYLDLMSQHSINSFDHTGNLFVDVGKPESLATAEAMFSV